MSYALTIPGLRVAVLVPNLQRCGGGCYARGRSQDHRSILGIGNAIACKNVRRTHEQMLAEVRAIASLVAAQPSARATDTRGRSVDGLRMYPRRSGIDRQES